MKEETNVYFELLDKLDDLCANNKLEYVFTYNNYPIQLKLQSLDHENNNGNDDPDITFEMINGDISCTISKDFTISDKLFTKIKSYFKKLYYSFLQMFYRDVVEGRLLRESYNPEPSDDPESPSRKHERHFIITKTVNNIETILNDYPPHLKDAAIKKYCWLGQHTKEGQGVIALYRGYQTDDKKLGEDSEQIHLYNKWLISQGLGVDPKTL